MGERPLPSGFVPDQAQSAAPSGFVSDTPSGGLSGFGEELWQRINPVNIASGLVQAAKAPMTGGVTSYLPSGLVNAIRADPKFLHEASDAAKAGDYGLAAQKALAFFSMGLGPELDKQATLLREGQYARGAGAMTGTGLGFVAPELAARGLAAVTPTMTPANPAVAQAVKAGQAAGVPVDAATATDNIAIRAAQQMADRSLGGSTVAGKASQAQAQGLATMGQQLAAKGYQTATTAEQAGQAVSSGVAQRVSDLGAQADAAYGKLRAIEAQRPIPVDLTSVKAALEPVYKTLAVGADIAPLQGAKATAVRAMARILQGPDMAMASEVDSALSDLKAVQRTAEGTPGAGAANQAVGQVSNALSQAVAKAGPDAVQALSAGRAATTAKYAAQDVLDSLNAEPVRTTKALTAPQDSAIQSLRAVQQQAPQTVPLIGRSVLDGLLDRATEAGGFAHADKLYADWQKLGDQTKAMLYPDPGYVKDLDNFFLLAKKMGEQANPSGTAHTLAVGSQLAAGAVNPLAFIGSVAGSAGVSALLHSRMGVNLLTNGLLSSSSPAAQAVWISRLRQFGAAQGLTLASATPSAGGSQ